MKILAIDPAAKCGWAHSSGASGVWDLSIRADESGGMRLLRFRSKLEEIKNLEGVDVLVYEASRNLKHGNAVRAHESLRATMQLWAEESGVAYKGYSPGEIKKHATGNGGASKAEMVKAAEEKWPDLKVIDDNHADALHLLDMVTQELGGGK